MNSPPEPASPSLSTPSSGSQTPEEPESSAFFPSPTNTTAHTLHGVSSALSGSTSTSGGVIGGVSASGTAKRRLHGVGGASSRDVKTRRREEPRKGANATAGGQGAAGAGGPGGSQWEGGKEGGKKDPREELLDAHVVEFLRKAIGDPFQEISFE